MARRFPSGRAQESITMAKLVREELNKTTAQAFTYNNTYNCGGSCSKYCVSLCLKP